MIEYRENGNNMKDYIVAQQRKEIIESMKRNMIWKARI